MDPASSFIVIPLATISRTPPLTRGGNLHDGRDICALRRPSLPGPKLVSGTIKYELSLLRQGFIGLYGYLASSVA